MMPHNIVADLPCLASETVFFAKLNTSIAYTPNNIMTHDSWVLTMWSTQHLLQILRKYWFWDALRLKSMSCAIFFFQKIQQIQVIRVSVQCSLNIHGLKKQNSSPAKAFIVPNMISTRPKHDQFTQSSLIRSCYAQNK